MRKIALLGIVAAMFVCLCASAQETYQFAERDTCKLYLDIWRAHTGSNTTFKGIPRPAIMFVFGGGFVSGARSETSVRNWFKTLNAEGYTVVAIDYRLGMKGYRVGKGLRGAVKAVDRFVLSQQVGVEDVFSAVSFLAEHPELNVPVDNLVISGSSAGAIISLACAHAIANGQTDGLPNGFTFKGVMSFAGGIISNQGKPKFPKSPCPLLLFHGTSDKIVAYKHQGTSRRGLWGSSFLAKRLKKQQYNYSIWRFKGLAHDVAAYMEVGWPIEKVFLEKNVMQGIRCEVDAMIDDPSLPTWKSWGAAKVQDLYQK